MQHTPLQQRYFSLQKKVFLYSSWILELVTSCRDVAGMIQAVDLPMEVVTFPGAPSQPASLRPSLTSCPFQQAPESCILTCTTPQGPSLAPITLLEAENNKVFIHFNTHISASSLLIKYTMNKFLTQSGSLQYYFNWEKYRWIIISFELNVFHCLSKKSRGNNPLFHFLHSQRGFSIPMI